MNDPHPLDDGQEWSDVRVLVTGGSQGIGLGLARRFAQLGARVAIVGRSTEHLTRAVDVLTAGGLTVEPVQADVGRSSDCRRLIQDVEGVLGGLDVLCANAGVYPEAALGEIDDELLEHVTAVNLAGTIRVVQAAVPLLKASSRGRIVLTSSITGPMTGFPGQSVYAATKAGQLGFMRSAAVELASSRVTINAVLPGSIATDGLGELGEDVLEQMRAAVPMGRLGVVDDVAHAAAYLASRGAAFVTGQTLVVDGGQTLPEFPAS